MENQILDEHFIYKIFYSCMTESYVTKIHHILAFILNTIKQVFVSVTLKTQKDDFFSPEIIVKYFVGENACLMIGNYYIKG